jgi:hypothetical protein
LTPGEDLRLKVIMMGTKRLGGGTLHWRPLGQGEFETLPLERVARSIYSARLSAARIAGRDIEYYVQASLGTDTMRFPVTAPGLNQTVVMMTQN